MSGALAVMLASGKPSPTVFSMTAGTSAPSVGFYRGVFGSVTPSPINPPIGGQLLSLVDVSGATSTLSIDGFSSDPGQSSITSVVSNSVTKTSAGVSSYSYAGGVATWNWATAFGFSNGNTYNPTTINY
jgi:hypothetical protein